MKAKVLNHHSIEELDEEVTRLAQAGESVAAVRLRRFYTNDTLKEAWDEVKRRQKISAQNTEGEG